MIILPRGHDCIVVVNGVKKKEKKSKDQHWIRIVLGKISTVSQPHRIIMAAHSLELIY